MDRKSSVGGYCLRLISDLMGILIVNSHAVYKLIYRKGMELLDFKIVAAKALIGSYSSHSRIAPAKDTSCQEVLPDSVSFTNQ